MICHRPAEAEKFRLEKLAEAHKLKTVLEAEAEAEAVKVRGEVRMIINIKIIFPVSSSHQLRENITTAN